MLAFLFLIKNFIELKKNKYFIFKTSANLINKIFIFILFYLKTNLKLKKNIFRSDSERFWYILILILVIRSII